MKTNDGHLEYSLGDGAQAGLRQRPVAHVDASSTCCSSVGGSIPAIAIPIPDPVAVAVKKVINHAPRLALGGRAGEGGRGASGGQCILLRGLVRTTGGWADGRIRGVADTCEWAT